MDLYLHHLFAPGRMESWKRSPSPPDLYAKQPRLSSEDEAESVRSSLPSTCTTTSSLDQIDGVCIPFQVFCNVYTFYISLASRASDQKYRYLSAFDSWVRGATFYPVPNTTDVQVTVELVAADSLVGESSCQECSKKAKDSGILEAVASVNWTEINSFDIQKIVRLHQILTQYYIIHK